MKEILSPRGDSSTLHKELGNKSKSKKYSAAEKGKSKVVDLEPEPDVISNRKKYSAAEKGKSKVLDLEPESDLISNREVENTFPWPPQIREGLYIHQVDGVNWLWSLHCKGKGGILCDDMGLGKTRQICSFTAGLFHSALIEKVLIVAPKSVLDQWFKDLSIVELSELVTMYSGRHTKTRESRLQHAVKNKGIILTTYGMAEKIRKAFCGSSCDYVFLDEGHLMKNDKTKRVKSLKEIEARHRFIITGTPVQNNLTEYKSLIEYCLPGLLGQSFEKEIEKPIVRGSRRNATDKKIKSANSAAEKLRSLTKPYILRRGKEEIVLPHKDEIVVWIPLCCRQRKFYKRVVDREGGNSSKRITNLQKICDHPSLFREKKEAKEAGDEDLLSKLKEAPRRRRIVSSKPKFIRDLIKNLVEEGHKVVVFSRFPKMLNIIEKYLPPLYNLKRIDGRTSDSDRTSRIKAFQEGEGYVFLFTSGVGGVGITLTEADRVIIVEPSWNPGVDNQSADRVFRIGQKRSVVVYRLITCNTIEEIMYRRQVFKTELSRSITEEELKKGKFNKKELKVFFSRPEGGFDVSPTQQQLFEDDHLIGRSDSLKTHVEFLRKLNVVDISFHDEVRS